MNDYYICQGCLTEVTPMEMWPLEYGDGVKPYCWECYMPRKGMSLRCQRILIRNDIREKRTCINEGDSICNHPAEE